jgi:predicted pyridoxine 5'-phosphate oxidase superfamily flavin-nucleotide-binding protein
VQPNVYNDGSRLLQDRFDARRLADRMQHRLAFTEHDRAFVERSCFFFLATVDADGSPDCSYKGGAPGFVRVVGGDTLAFPNYDGNGQYRSLGNVLVNPHVALLFVDFENPGRRRVNGVATLHYDDPLLAEYPGAQLIVRVRATEIFGNCPRYIHKMQIVEHSAYVPACDLEPPIPEWKNDPQYKDALPRNDPARPA